MDFSHIDSKGKAQMVNIENKDVVNRTAIAEGFIYLNTETIEKIKQFELKKGDVLTVAKVAGIQAAKNTSNLIPLCHPLSLNHVDIQFEIFNNAIKAQSYVNCHGKTGVEMEALTAVSIALLTIYDMCKAVDKNMIIKDIRLVEKHKTEIK